MGLFEKRVKVANRDEFDSPVEEVKLTSVPKVEVQVREVPPQPPPQPERAEYGIDKTIELMRRLPESNGEMVVRVVKTTLESLGISVGSIVRDAERKEARLRGRIEAVRKEIGELESEIATRKKEIAQLVEDERETIEVKERLAASERQNAGERQKTTVSGEIRRPARSTPPPIPTSTFRSIESTLDELWEVGDPKKK